MNSCFEKWLWIDLIGFDLEQTDCAVPKLLDKAQFVPEAVILLLGNAEFVHLHAGAADERPFLPDVCSYGGHPHNEERERQAWHPKALHRLVRTLQSRGIKVLFSVFDTGTPSTWLKQHPEIYYVTSNGERRQSICPWKRLADGTFYEDFFVQQLQRVVDDYGFDGFHGADGYGHPRLALHEGDFSDDMVGQFLQDTSISLPPTIRAACAANPDDISRRAAWIWTQKRLEWVNFHTRRTERFWRKVADLLHATGKQLVLNTCWTRDPFEAVCRYGVDYQALAAAGADAFVVEAAGAVQELGGDLPYGTAHGRSWLGWDPAHILCRFQTTIMLIKAAVPHTKLMFLNGVKDTNESWNGLRHAPTNLESEITMHGNVFIQEKGDSPTRCTDGPLVCLADGIRPEEWQWLNEVWGRAFAWPVQNVLGATVLWSDNVLKRQLEHYMSTRSCPAGRLLHELVVQGAPLYSIQRLEDLQETTDPLVILHPQLYDEDELETIFSRAHGPLFLIGSPAPEPLAKPVVEYASSQDVKALWCSVYGVAEGVVMPPVPPANEVSIPTVPDSDPPSWIYEMPMAPIAPDFFAGCANAIAEVSGAPRVLENADSVRVWAAENQIGTIRLFIRNDTFYYRLAKIDVRRQLRAIQVRTQFPGSPIRFEGSCFHVKIPGKGIVIADLEVGV